MIFNKDAIPFTKRKNSLFSTNSAGKVLISVCKLLKIDPFLTAYTNINSKWISTLNRSTKIIKHFQENVVINLQDIGFGN